SKTSTASNGNDGSLQRARSESTGRMSPPSTTTAGVLRLVQYVVHFHRITACSLGAVDHGSFSGGSLLHPSDLACGLDVHHPEDDSYNCRSRPGEDDDDHAGDVRVHVHPRPGRIDPLLDGGQPCRYRATGLHQQILVAAVGSEASGKESAKGKQRQVTPCVK